VMSCIEVRVCHNVIKTEVRHFVIFEGPVPGRLIFLTMVFASPFDRVLGTNVSLSSEYTSKIDRFPF
jgi:hypothetical protein